MFRLTTKVTNIIIDMDSFCEKEMVEWHLFSGCVNCFFVVTTEDSVKNIEGEYGAGVACLIPDFKRQFAPNPAIHAEILNKFGILSTETVYVSKDIEFLKRAMSILGGTVWLTESFTYEDFSTAPDMIFNNISHFCDALKENVRGHLGEVAVCPDTSGKGLVLSTEIEVDGEPVELWTVGRYFGSNTYLYMLHPLSRAIYLNKRPGKNYTGRFTELFSKLYAIEVKRIQREHAVDGIVSVPTKPGQENRFKEILRVISEQCGVKDFGNEFVCTRSYTSQKELDAAERMVNIQGAFSCTDALKDKTVVLIDDIASTGTTIKECVRVLKRAGVSKVIIAVLAINQWPPINYWSSEEAGCICPKCRRRMTLWYDVLNGFKFSCFDCNQEYSYCDGRETLIERENNLWKKIYLKPLKNDIFG